MGSLPWLVQFLLAVLVADIAEYWIHRALHVVPWLWRFMPFTIPLRRSTGSQGRAPTSWTTS